MGFYDTRLAALAAGHSAASLDHFLAQSPKQREAIYRLRYEAYLRDGLINENSKGRLSDQYDAAPDTAIFGVTLNSKLVSTIRLNLLNKNRKSSATYAAFGDYLDQILDRGDSVADGSRLAVCCEKTAVRRQIILYTLKLAAVFADSFKADFGAISVRKSHAPFYQRYGFGVMSDPRPYNAMVTPLSLMMIGLRKGNDSSITGCACQSNSE